LAQTAIVAASEISTGTRGMSLSGPNPDKRTNITEIART
jgi:hypothetical protein